VDYAYLPTATSLNVAVMVFPPYQDSFIFDAHCGCYHRRA